MPRLLWVSLDAPFILLVLSWGGSFQESHLKYWIFGFQLLRYTHLEAFITLNERVPPYERLGSKWVKESWQAVKLKTKKFFNWVMALGLCQNFIPIKYLENKLMDFDEIICMKFCWSFQQSYGPWLMLKFKFFSISLEIMNRFWLNFVYALIYMIHVVTNIHYFPEHCNRVMTLDWFYAQYLVK